MAWATGQPRRNATLAKATIAKAKGICYICHKPGANQADHIIPLAEGGTDNPDNMGAIHATPCHQDKTQAEAARGKARRSRRRPKPEQHPSTTTQGGG